MGAAKRRAQAKWSKSICSTCMTLGDYPDWRPEVVAAYEKDHPHSCYADPGPMPKVELTKLEILIPRSVAGAINDLHEFVIKQYPSRNDFLEDLLKEGLKSALQAQQAAIAQMQADQLAAQHVEEPLVQLATVIPKGMEDASARLRALRGEQP